MIMNKVSGEQLDSAKRGGFLIGMAVAELMVLILLALVLFLVFREKKYEEQDQLFELAGGKDNVQVIVDAISANSGGADLFTNPEVIETIVSITTKQVLNGASSLSEDLLVAIADENKKLQETNSALEGARQSLLNQILAMTTGGTTLCVYTPSTDLSKLRGRSVPIGVLRLEGEEIEIVSLGYPDQSRFVSFDGLDYGDTTNDILTDWQIGQVLSLDEFSELSQRLAMNGDTYRTDSRSNCRHYFNYFFDNGTVTADFKERFDQLNYSGVRLTELSPDSNLRRDPVTVEKDIILNEGESELQLNDGVADSLDFIDGNFEYKPLEEPNPRYPLAARRDGTEGSVLLQFAVSERGEVIEESIEIIESSDTVFERSSIDAISKSKFLPRIVNGRAEIVRNIRYRISYVLVN